MIDWEGGGRPESLEGILPERNGSRRRSLEVDTNRKIMRETEER